MSDERTAAIVRAYIQNLQFTYGEYSMAFARCIQNSYLQGGPPFARHKAAAAAGALCDGHAGRADRDRVHVQPAGTGLHEVRQGAERDRPVALPGRSATIRPMCSGPGWPRRSRPLPRNRPRNSLRKSQPERPRKRALKSLRQSPLKRPAAAQPAEGKTATAAPVRTPEKPAVQPLRYTIQVMASASPVPLASAQFRAYTRQGEAVSRPRGVSPTNTVWENTKPAPRPSARLAEVRRVFPEAFVVSCRGTQIVK